MNLVKLQTDYFNNIDTMDKERPTSPTLLRTFYEILRYKMEPKQAYKQAYSVFRAIVNGLNDR